MVLLLGASRTSTAAPGGYRHSERLGSRLPVRKGGHDAAPVVMDAAAPSGETGSLLAARTTGAPALGRVKVKVLPCPGVLSTPRWPPCIATNRRDSASPSPVPSCTLDLRACSNSSKILA